MSSAGARAANCLVRLVQSGPLEMRMLTQRVSSGTERRPPGCPAKTFKMVIGKLTPRPCDEQMLTTAERVAGSMGLVGSVRAANRVVHRFWPNQGTTRSIKGAATGWAGFEI